MLRGRTNYEHAATNPRKVIDYLQYGVLVREIRAVLAILETIFSRRIRNRVEQPNQYYRNFPRCMLSSFATPRSSGPTVTIDDK